MLWAQSTTKDYIRAEQKLHSISKSFISQVIISQVMFLSLFIFRGHSTREPASSRVTYFILPAYTGTGVSHSQQEKIGRGFGKNAGEWTRRVEISKEEIPGSKHSMYGYIYTNLLQALKGDCLSSVFSPDGTLISASAAPHCGRETERIL